MASNGGNILVLREYSKFGIVASNNRLFDSGFEMSCSSRTVRNVRNDTGSGVQICFKNKLAG